MTPFIMTGHREMPSEEKMQEYLAHFKRTNHEATYESVVKAIASDVGAEIWQNDTYIVLKKCATKSDVKLSDEIADAWYLSIKRIDQEPIVYWRDLQTIKSELVGRKNEGMQIFPSEDRLVDTANQYHLFVFKDEKLNIPYGFNGGRHISDSNMKGTKQKPLKENE